MNISFARWAGPFVGLLVGLIIGILNGIKIHSLGFWGPLEIGGGVGLAGGFLAMLADPVGTKSSDGQRAGLSATPTFSGNALAIISLIFFFLPFFSIVLSGLGIATNWKVKGWAWWLSWLGLLLGLMMTTTLVWLWISHPKGDG